MYNIFFLYTLLLASCHNQHKETKHTENIKCIRVMQTIPEFNANGKLMSYDTNTIEVYYFNNLRAYYLTYRYDSSDFDGTKFKSEIRHHYSIFKSGERFGIDYDYNKKVPARKINRDSLFNIEWIGRNYLYDIYAGSFPILKTYRQNEILNTIDVEYSFRDKKDTAIILAEGFLSYNKKLIPFDVSISKQFDSLYNSKLCAARFIYHKTITEKRGKHADEFESSFWLSEIDIPNKSEILKYFQLFEEDYKKLIN